MLSIHIDFSKLCTKGDIIAPLPSIETTVVTCIHMNWKLKPFPQKLQTDHVLWWSDFKENNIIFLLYSAFLLIGMVTCLVIWRKFNNKIKENYIYENIMSVLSLSSWPKQQTYTCLLQNNVNIYIKRKPWKEIKIGDAGNSILRNFIRSVTNSLTAAVVQLCFEGYIVFLSMYDLYEM